MAALFAAPTSAAPERADQALAVLEFTNKLLTADKASVDTGYFADRVREAALDELPQLRVITRENLLVLLKSAGRKLEECEGECEVETGRRVGADLVISGEILKVGSSFKLNMRLHETHEGRLLGAALAAGKSVDELDGATARAVRKLLGPLRAAKAEAPPAEARDVSCAAIDKIVAAASSGFESLKAIGSPLEAAWATYWNVDVVVPGTEKADSCSVTVPKKRADRRPFYYCNLAVNAGSERIATSYRTTQSWMKTCFGKPWVHDAATVEGALLANNWSNGGVTVELKQMADSVQVNVRDSNSRQSNGGSSEFCTSLDKIIAAAPGEFEGLKTGTPSTQPWATYWRASVTVPGTEGSDGCLVMRAKKADRPQYYCHLLTNAPLPRLEAAYRAAQDSINACLRAPWVYDPDRPVAGEGGKVMSRWTREGTSVQLTKKSDDVMIEVLR